MGKRGCAHRCVGGGAEERENLFMVVGGTVVHAAAEFNLFFACVEFISFSDGI